MASTIKVNTIQDSCGSALVSKCGSTITLGASGKTVAIASGASTSGMGRTGTVDWCMTAKTSPFTAVSGTGYMVNTCGGAITVTLPSSPSAGAIVSLKDYKGTWGTACKAVTLGRNSSKISGSTLDAILNTSNQVVTMAYVDGTQGWLNVQTDTVVEGESFVAASGGNTTITCGDYKVHIFTADGPLNVTNAGNSAGSNTVSYLVVGGGGGSAAGISNSGGGGGAGGYREGKASSDCFTASPLVAPGGLAVSVQDYPITVGAGGAAGAATPGANGTNGSVSTFSSISSAGGGYGASTTQVGGNGGSGGGPSFTAAASVGNTPPVSPPQGMPGGGPGAPPSSGANGGGGALAAGASIAAPPDPDGAPGGNGANIGTNFFGPTAPTYGTPGTNPGRYFAGGGGGSGYGAPAPAQLGAGGEGGGGAGGSSTGTTGTANTGGGAGGGKGGQPSPGAGGAGGSGFVAIRYKFQ